MVLFPFFVLSTFAFFRAVRFTFVRLFEPWNFVIQKTGNIRFPKKKVEISRQFKITRKGRASGGKPLVEPVSILHYYNSPWRLNSASLVPLF